MFAAFSRYADFTGRSGRSEYWLFFLFQCLLAFGMTFGPLVMAMLGLSLLVPAARILCAVTLVATLVPGLSVTVRRLHDTGLTGWMALLLLPSVPVNATDSLMNVLVMQSYFGNARLAWQGIALVMSNPLMSQWIHLMPAARTVAAVSALALLVVLCLKGTAGPNAYGDIPPDNTRENTGEPRAANPVSTADDVPARLRPLSSAGASQPASGFGRRR